MENEAWMVITAPILHPSTSSGRRRKFILNYIYHCGESIAAERYGQLEYGDKK